MYRLASMWKQHKQRDETSITMNPHKWKYYDSHTKLVHKHRPSKNSKLTRISLSEKWSQCRRALTCNISYGYKAWICLLHKQVFWEEEKKEMTRKFLPYSHLISVKTFFWQVYERIINHSWEADGNNMFANVCVCVSLCY